MTLGEDERNGEGLQPAEPRGDEAFVSSGGSVLATRRRKNLVLPLGAFASMR